MFPASFLYMHCFKVLSEDAIFNSVERPFRYFISLSERHFCPVFSCFFSFNCFFSGIIFSLLVDHSSCFLLYCCSWPTDVIHHLLVSVLSERLHQATVKKTLF